MLAKYEISLSNSSIYRNESLIQVLDSLEKLENISNEIYGNLNKTILEKKLKLENLHSRLVRINKILGILENIPTAITLLSKKFYPENLESYQSKSVYYNDICDFSLSQQVNRFKEPNKKLNSKPANSLDELGTTPDSNLDDLKLTQEILNSMNGFNNVQKTFSTMNSLNPVDTQPITEDIEMLTSVFNFTSRIKAFGNEITKEVARESNLLNQFIKQNRANSITNQKKSKKDRKKPDKAPETLLTNTTKTKANVNKQFVLKNKTKVNNEDIINSKIKTTLNIGNIVNIEDTGENNLIGFYNENNQEEENNEDSQIIPNDQVVADDINTFDMPIDKVYQINKKKIEDQYSNNNNINNNINSNVTPNSTTNNQGNTVNTNTTANLTTNSVNNTQNINNQNTNTLTNNTNDNNNNQMVGSNNVNTNYANTSNTNANVNNNAVSQNIPKVPNVNSTVNTSTVPNIPSIPNISSAIPKIPTIPNAPTIQVVTNTNSNVPKAPKINIPVPKIKPLKPEKEEVIKKEEEEKILEEEEKKPAKEPQKDPVNKDYF